MKIIIATFGEDPGGIIANIRQTGCDKLILLIPKNLTKDGKEGIKELEKITQEIKIKLEKLIVSPYSFMENIHKIKELISSQSGNDVILNVTGGRKTLSIAATLVGFVSKPSNILYFQEETGQPIEIPKFTLEEKILSQPKRAILGCIKSETTLEEVKNCLKAKGNKSVAYHNIKKHIRGLSEKELIKVNNTWPQTYTITPNGELLR